MKSSKSKRNVILVIGAVVLAAIQYLTIRFNGFDGINVLSFIILHALYSNAVRRHFEGSIYVEKHYLKG
jgi:hypothetical protein